MLATLCFVALTLSGCFNITSELMPPNQTVHATLTGEDCSITILGFGYGNNDWNAALQTYNKETIHRVHSARLRTVQFGPFGHHCLEITGE